MAVSSTLVGSLAGGPDMNTIPISFVQSGNATGEYTYATFTVPEGSTANMSLVLDFFDSKSKSSSNVGHVYLNSNQIGYCAGAHGTTVGNLTGTNVIKGVRRSTTTSGSVNCHGMLYWWED